MLLPGWQALLGPASYVPEPVTRAAGRYSPAAVWFSCFPFLNCLSKNTMGLYDRDYVKTSNPASLGNPAGGGRGSFGNGGGGRFGGGGGNFFQRMREWPFNTWLIVVNVAVFVIFGVFFYNPKNDVTIGWGREYFTNVLPAVIDRGVVVPGPRERHPTLPNVTFNRIVDPQDVLKTDDGTIVLEKNTREPIQRVIGRQRFMTERPDQAFGHFSTGKGFMEFEVWRVLTFQFLHANMTHLLFNMLGLFMFGGLVEQALGKKRYAAFYLVCGIAGALMYLFLNFTGNMLLLTGIKIPGLLFDDLYTPLVGASAGIFGVLLAAAYLAPKEIVMVFFVLPMKLKHAVYAFVAIALGSLIWGTSNAGGEAAHIGGALAGAFFIRRTYLLRDFFDILGPRKPAGGKPKPPRGYNPKLKFVAAGDAPAGANTTAAATAPSSEAAEVDRILQTLSTKGRAGLTEKELATLEAHRVRLQAQEKR